MIILDSNVLSELTKAEPDAAVLAWADSVHGPAAATTAITVAELLFGVARLPDGRRKAALHDAVRQLIDVDLGGRAHPFDYAAAVQYAAIVTDRVAAGRPISVSDAQIAAICRSRGARLATRNTRDFAGTGIELINPFDS
ncbi:MAG TPA: type II toxin-antitoxin system VapC family toxin [Streptosporangiaceae bacterium]|nr:type II toxin-antitoxin system VapC family toxin [Streptosporangiaceae bacterium]